MQEEEIVYEHYIEDAVIENGEGGFDYLGTR